MFSVDSFNMHVDILIDVMIIQRILLYCLRCIVSTGHGKPGTPGNTWEITILTDYL